MNKSILPLLCILILLIPKAVVESLLNTSINWYNSISAFVYGNIPTGIPILNAVDSSLLCIVIIVCLIEVSN